MDENTFKKILLQKKKQLESHIKEMEKTDLSSTEAVREIEDVAAAAYFTERNSRILVIKRHIEDMLKKINYSLERVKKGTYGICDNCGKNINMERLLALPVTIFCISCVSYR